MSSPIHCEIVFLPVNGGYVRAMVICINTPSSTQNIVDPTFGLELGKAVYYANELAEDQKNDNGIDLVVVCSGKSNTFIAGADIKTMLSCIGQQGEQRIFIDTFKLNSIYCMLETMPVPTIAIINGTVLGAGLELVMSCDYRVIDASLGKQIGLPEVKIGLLPGAGGCFRLPYLVGLRQALPIILTGGSVSATQALRMGLADSLWKQTQSVCVNGSYDYEWRDELVHCIGTGRIGKRVFKVSNLKSSPLPDSINCILSSISEEDIMKQSKLSWPALDKKAVHKYKHRPSVVSPTLFSPMHYLMDCLVYIVSAIQLKRKIGQTMPAPYSALKCTWRCYHASSIREGVVECSSNFAALVRSAESKCLMSLFLQARNLKKESLAVAAGSDVPSSVSDSAPKIIIVTDDIRGGATYTVQFVQSLIYNDFEVGVVITDSKGTNTWEKFAARVEKLFEYSVSKGHMTRLAVGNKVKKLLQPVFTVPELDKEPSSIIINACFSSTSHIKCNCTIVPCDGTTDEGVLLHLGDPLRNNSLSAEVMSKVPSAVAKQACTVVARLGKTPVLTPPHSNVAWKLALAHWSLAVKVAMEMGVRVEYLDKALKASGFTHGPFAIMKKLDRSTLICAVETLRKDDHLLLDYIKNPSKTIRYRTTPNSRPHPKALMTIFAANSVLVSLELLMQYGAGGGDEDTPQLLSSDAVDFLCVSGLVYFPPSEGGPINYLKRNGRGTLINELKELQCTSNKLKDYGMFLSKQLTEMESGCGLTLLSDDDMARIGPTQGAAHHVSSLTYPFPFGARSLFIPSLVATIAVALLLFLLF